MQYITHTRYKGKTLKGEDILIRRGKPLVRNGDVLFFKDKPICIYRSLIGKQHFAINKDNKGLERGYITYELAYSPRIRIGGTKEQPRQQRFTDDELKILTTEWSKYIKPDCDMLLFNDEFFEAPIEILKKIAESVHIDLLPTIKENTPCIE